MKTFISNEDFQRVLELLGLPGETLEFRVGSRDVPTAGVNSSWLLTAIIADQPYHNCCECPCPDSEPYQTRTVYIPVLLPSDVPPPAEAAPGKLHWDAYQYEK